MQRTGLYYPYVHFRDPAWIKAAALYLPGVARVVPEGFHVSDPDHVRVLRDDLDFIQNIDPADAVEAASRHLLRLVDERGEEVRSRFGVHGTGGPDAMDVVNAEPSPPGTPAPVGNRERFFSPRGRPLAGLYPGEMSPELRDTLFGTGLAVRRVRNAVSHDAHHAWVGMDPALAWVYKCALTAELAGRTAFLPVTDQEAAHTAIDPWDAERMAAVLLGGAPAPVGTGDLAGRVGVLSVRCVLPARLAGVPAEKIVELRKKYEPEFFAYMDAIARTTADLREELAGIRSRQALDLYVRQAVHKDFEVELVKLREAMKGVGLQTITTSVSTTFDTPTSAALASGLFGTVGGTVAGSAAGIVAGVGATAVGILGGARRQRDAALAASPVSFLLRIERGLKPTTAVSRIGRALRRSAGASV
ncbi:MULTISPECIES: DUF6236 family protein [Streptomyces]|uniref:DUF6236 family protein n=1 Tax=Streptomyces TaxID=1883 RepID=UPI001E3C75F9|nr:MULTISPECIES: DUF6236 family protein [Streptomyces]